MVKLVIDQRETEIKEYYKLHSHLHDYVEYINLDIGDFVIKNEDKIEYLIERKTVKDVLQSIKDGRYKEQKMRMLNHVPKNRILYIIENIGTIDSFDIKQQNIIYGFMLNSIMRDGLHMIYTNNIKHTIDLLGRIYNKVKSGIFKDSLDVCYTSTLKIKKKENMTPNRCFIMQLCQIPGVSVLIATAVAKDYPSFTSLYSQYMKELSCSFLEKIEVSKSRKVGKKTAVKIGEYLQLV